jgi:hypothetical protein
VVRRFNTLDCSVDGGESVSEIGGEGPGLKGVESLVELVYIGSPEDNPIAICSIQDAMERRPSHRSCMSGDMMLLGGISNSSH